MEITLAIQLIISKYSELVIKIKNHSQWLLLVFSLSFYWP